jgi:hypothetical protein
MSFASEWSQAKRDFEAQTGQKKPTPVAKTLAGIERKSTDIASAPGAIDAALAKKSRNVQKFVTNLWPSRIKRQKEMLDAAVRG